MAAAVLDAVEGRPWRLRLPHRHRAQAGDYLEQQAAVLAMAITRHCSADDVGRSRT